MKKLIRQIVEKSGYTIQKVDEQDFNFQKVYNDFKEFTMIPSKQYMENLRIAYHYGSSIEGDVVECGVWRGGMIAGLSIILGKGRHYYLCDSFEGLPKAKEIDGKDAIAWQNNKTSNLYYDNCKAEIDFAHEAMKKAGVTYNLIKGWFSETLPSFSINNPIAVLRLDGDWYESTMDCLKYLFPKVAKMGLIIIDDYYTWEGCSKAVHDYLSSIKSVSRIYTSQRGICYIIKLD